MEFIPDDKNVATDVPYFEDVREQSGWAGHTTRKGEIDLQAEISAAIGRLGGMVTGWQRGKFGTRNGYRMLFTISDESGKLIPGRFDVLALPLKTSPNARSHDTKVDQSLRMALFNLRNQLEAAWRMQMLVPGYFALLPQMLVAGQDMTVGQLWVERENLHNLLPAGDEEDDEMIIDADYEEAE